MKPIYTMCSIFADFENKIQANIVSKLIKIMSLLLGIFCCVWLVDLVEKIVGWILLCLWVLLVHGLLGLVVAGVRSILLGLVGWIGGFRADLGGFRGGSSIGIFCRAVWADFEGNWGKFAVFGRLFEAFGRGMLACFEGLLGLLGGIGLGVLWCLFRWFLEEAYLGFLVAVGSVIRWIWIIFEGFFLNLEDLCTNSAHFWWKFRCFWKGIGRIIVSGLVEIRCQIEILCCCWRRFRAAFRICPKIDRSQRILQRLNRICFFDGFYGCFIKIWIAKNLKRMNREQRRESLWRTEFLLILSILCALLKGNRVLLGGFLRIAVGDLVGRILRWFECIFRFQVVILYSGRANLR